MPLPPIRNKVEIQKLKEKKEKEIFSKQEVKESDKKLQRDVTPMFDYYKNWDKFAAEETGKLDSKEEDDILEAKNPVAEADKGPMSQAEMMKRTSGAKPNTKMVIKGGSVKKSSMADTLKA